MSHALPTWIERLLGIDAKAGEGATWSIETAWPWPPWATLLFVALAAALVVAIYLRQRRRGTRRYRLMLAVVRLALVAIVLLMIAQVTLSLRRTGLPCAAVLVDDSLSMTIVDHYAERPRQALEARLKRSGLESGELSRWNLARMALTQDNGALLRGIGENHKLRVALLTGVRSTRQSDAPGVIEELRTATPQGETTRLGGGIRSVLDQLRGSSPAALVVLTDGINTDGPSLADGAEYARRRGVPLFFIGTGSDRPVRDLRLSDLMVDDVVFLGDVVPFECKLTASGFEGKKLSIVLREKGKPDVLAKVQANAGRDGQSQQVRLTYRPKQVGQLEYVVEVQPQEGELQTENNRLSRIVQVRKEKIRVLLVYAYPSFEYRYLRNMLQRDETIALNTVLQDADLEHAEQDASALRAFPLRRDELFAYDVVILGDANPTLLGSAALKNLVDFVDQPAKGGALVLVAGPSFMPAAYRNTPLARLLPFAADGGRFPNPADAITESFVVQPTDLGLADPAMQLGNTREETEAIWRRLAPVDWLLPLPPLKPGVRVLAEHPKQTDADGRRLPVFCFQYVGAGKVLFHATDATWHWRYRVGDVYFARYWVQTIRNLCRSKLGESGRTVTLLADRREYVQGETARLRVRFADERLAPADDNGVALVVERAGGKTQRIRLRRTTAGRGVFEGALERLAAGNYHAWIAEPTVEGQTPTADFTVAPPAGEFAQVRMESAEMRRAAEITGGRFYTVETADRLLGDLPPGRQVPIEALPPVPLWNRWPVLALFLVLITAEWILRKWRGMV
jgi:hypothetical protein